MTGELVCWGRIVRMTATSGTRTNAAVRTFIVALMSKKRPGTHISALMMSAAAFSRIARRSPEFQASTAQTTETMPMTAASTRKPYGGGPSVLQIDTLGEHRQIGEPDKGGEGEAGPAAGAGAEGGGPVGG